MTREMKKFDDVLVEFGEFGRYQVYIYNLLCLFEFVAPWQTLVLVFLAGEPDHWCKISEWDSVDCASHGFNTTWQCDLAKKEVGIPWNYTDDNEQVYESCTRYNTSGVAFSPDLNLQGYEKVGCDAGWEYDNQGSASMTINQEFDLVCGSEYQITLSQSLFFAGSAVGSFVVGVAADRFGRHHIIFSCLSLYVLSGLAIAFSTNIWMFVIIRIVAGASTCGFIATAFVLANEFVGPSKRNVAGNAIWVYYSLGYMTLALIAYFITNWRHLQLTITLIPCLLFLLYGIIPESARWLMSRNREVEASKIMRKMAKVNKVEIKDTFNMKNMVVQTEGETVKEEGFLQILRMPRLRLYTLNIMFNLVVNTIVYFGLSLSTDTLGVNPYIAFAIAGAVEMPACFSVIYPIEYWGRRPVYMLLMFMSGFTILITIFIPAGPWRAVVAMFGKFAITASFCIIYLHAVEIFPTPVRNAALGTCTLCSNIINILCPQFLMLRHIWEPFPLVIFGSLSIIAGCVAYFLPETRGKKIPETMEEGENIGWKAGPRRRRAPKSGALSDVKYHKAAGDEVGEHV